MAPYAPITCNMNGFYAEFVNYINMKYTILIFLTLNLWVNVGQMQPVTTESGLDHLTTENVGQEVKDDGSLLEKTNTAMEISYNIQNNDSEKMTQVATLVEALENLGILSAERLTCYTLNKIVKFSEQTTEPGLWRVGIHLYVKEIGVGKGRPEEGQTTAQGQTSLNSVEVDNKMSASTSGEGESECIYLPNTPVDIAPTDKTSNDTGQTVNATGKGQQIKEEDLESERNGLSRTQVMVIATCSTVIGVFFLLAFFLRLRNYLKRIREDVEAERKPKFRSCSVTLRGSTTQSIDSRSNSSSTKDKCPLPLLYDITQPSPRDVDSNTLSPHLGSPDSHPLLVISPASAPTSPSFAGRSNSCDYIPDNENKRISKRDVFNGSLKNRDFYKQIMKEIEQDVRTRSFSGTITRPKSQPTKQKSQSLKYNIPPYKNSPRNDSHNRGSIKSNGTRGSFHMPRIKEKEDDHDHGSKVVTESKEKLINSKEDVMELRSPSMTTFQSPIPLTRDCLSSRDNSNHSLVSIGLTQSDSDSSLSSDKNQSYCYGNQVEYMPSYSGGLSETSFVNKTNTNPGLKPNGKVCKMEDKIFQNPPPIVTIIPPDSEPKMNGNAFHVVMDTQEDNPVDNTLMQNHCNKKDDRKKAINDKHRGKVPPQKPNHYKTRQKIMSTDSNSTDEINMSDDEATAKLLGSKPKKHHSPYLRRPGWSEKSFLLGEEFEGMEPTYV